MNTDFITLCKLGVGPVIVRHDDIVTMELTPMGVTRIEFGYGEHLIVEEPPFQILKLIRLQEELKTQLEELKSNGATNT